MRNEKTKDRIKISLIVFITAVIVFIIPLSLTIGIKTQVDLYNFSPTEESKDKLKNHIEEHSWIFSLLNLAKDLPYYKVAPNVGDVGPAVEHISTEGVVVGTVPFDSLSCLVRETYNTEKVLELSGNDWADCEYVKDFGWGFTSTGEPAPKIDITIGLTGFLIILFAIFILWNSFILLLIGSIKTTYSLISYTFKISGTR